jgi:hypothetical protein
MAMLALPNQLSVKNKINEVVFCINVINIFVNSMNSALAHAAAQRNVLELKPQPNSLVIKMNGDRISQKI